MKFKGCCYPGCLKRGEWHPSIIVRYADSDKTFELDFDKYSVCDEHRKGLTLDDIVGGDVLTKITEMFKQKFIHPPKKENLHLKWNLDIMPIFSNGFHIGNTNVRRR